MRKEDLENLMVVVTENDDRFLVVDDKLVNESRVIDLSWYDENLMSTVSREDSLTKIYDTGCVLKDIDRYGELLWKRQWAPKMDEKYYFPDITIESIGWNYWSNDKIDNYRLSLGIVYKTAEEAIEHKKRILKMINNKGGIRYDK